MYDNVIIIFVYPTSKKEGDRKEIGQYKWLHIIIHESEDIWLDLL